MHLWPQDSQRSWALLRIVCPHRRMGRHCAPEGHRSRITPAIQPPPSYLSPMRTAQLLPPRLPKPSRHGHGHPARLEPSKRCRRPRDPVRSPTCLGRWRLGTAARPCATQRRRAPSRILLHARTALAAAPVSRASAHLRNIRLKQHRMHIQWARAALAGIAPAWKHATTHAHAECRRQRTWRLPAPRLRHLAARLAGPAAAQRLSPRCPKGCAHGRART